MAGRKENSIWQFYIKTTDPNKLGCRATCKNCKKEIQGIVKRLKDHHDFCNKQQETNTGRYIICFFIIITYFLAYLFFFIFI